ncbi:hypothetical protein PILCRDRAFT_12814 [Piloderma croceum F 1598]|uniref:Uncharacterized protein n=1 Tax=Piloderma croceum (strain F 1598) TaxID=765440 RepID=A0A0C3F9H3_PILCF|nr:hypothetical protein PILCRDRAFT_12814 [Piloderma croceum F 1598]
MPRAARPLSKPRHDPLHVQIDNDRTTSTPTRRLIRRQKNHHRNSLSDENQILDIRATQKFLDLATDQQAEIELNDGKVVAAADEHDMQLRDSTNFSEDEDDTSDASDSGHDVWSPYSCRMATKVFISSMKPEQARIYLQFVLLNAVRTDIADNNKLNVHYYEALIRAMYKPATFFKDIVFPLLETGCNLKKAAIIASVLAKKTIPSVHLGAAIINIAKSDFSGEARVITELKLGLLTRHCGVRSEGSVSPGPY